MVTFDSAQAELSKMYKTLDPDGSGLISYVEFQREFGSAIAGEIGGDSIRWGYSSVPLKHSKAAEYSVVRVLCSFATILTRVDRDCNSSQLCLLLPFSYFYLFSWPKNIFLSPP